jgi:hypothetical protein
MRPGTSRSLSTLFAGISAVTMPSCLNSFFTEPRALIAFFGSSAPGTAWITTSSFLPFALPAAWRTPGAT